MALDNKKARLIVSEGSPLVFVRFDSREPTIEHVLYLESFEVKDNNVKWSMFDNQGRIYEGNHLSEVKLPFYPGASMCVSIPVTLHKRNHARERLGVEFIFRLPHTRQAHSYWSLKKKYPDLPALTNF